MTDALLLWQYHFNARWYDADTARFVSEDPARDGVSWFAYVGQNPLRYIDPTGLTLTQQFDSGIAGTTDISEREYAEYYDWALRSGLKDDIKTKAQFSDLEERLDAIHHIRSLQNVADLGGPLQRNIEAQLTAAMGEYNRRYFNDISPLDGLEGSYVTTEFGATIVASHIKLA